LLKLRQHLAPPPDIGQRRRLKVPGHSFILPDVF